MADNSINVQITAESSGFVGGVGQSEAALKTLETELATLRASLATAAAGMAQFAAASAEFKAAAEDQAGITALREQIAAREASIAQINAETIARRELASVAAANAQADAGAFTGAKYTSIAPEIEQDVEAQGHLKVATAGTTREFIVLGHEVVSGNFNRIPGSLIVLAERMGSLHTIVEALTGVWGAVAIAGVAALGAIGYAAYEAVEGMLALRDASDRFAEGGAGFSEAEAQAKQFTDLLSSQFRETNGVIKEMAVELQKLPAAALPAASALAQVAEWLAQARNTDAATAFKEVVGAARGGPEAFLKWAEAQYNLQGALTNTGESLSDYVKAEVEAGTPGPALLAIIAAINDAFGGQEAQARKAENALREYARAAATVIAGGVEPLQALGPAPEAPKRAAEYPRTGPPPLGPEITAGVETAQKVTTEDERRLAIQAQINSLKTAEAAIQERIQIAQQEEPNAPGKSGLDQQAAGLQDQLARIQQAQADLAAEAGKVHGAGETEAHAATMALLAGELEAERNNAQQVIAIRKQMVDAEVEYQAQAIARSTGVSVEQARPQAQQTSGAIAAENQYQSAVRSLRETEFHTWIDQMREAETEAGKSGAQRIAIEEEVNRAIHAAAGGPAPTVNAQAVEAADRRLAEVKRQAAVEASQAVIAGLDEELRAAQHNAAARVAIEQKKADEIRRLAMEPLLAQGKTPEQARTEANQQPQVIAGDNAVKDAARAADEDKLQSTIETERARVAETERGSQERLQAEKNILGELMAAQQQGLVSARAVEEQQVRLAEAEKETREAAYRAFAAAEKQKVVEAKGDADAILAIYRDWADQAATIYQQAPSVVTNINTEGTRAAQEAQQKTFSTAEGDTRDTESVSRQRIAIDKAEQDIKVSTHQESKAEEFEQEQAFTAELESEVEKRLQAELAAAGTNRDEQIKALQDIATADQQMAEQIIQDQAKITEAIQQENAKQLESFKTAFDEIGTSANEAIKGLIDGQRGIIQQQHVAANGVVFYTDKYISPILTAGQKLLSGAASSVENLGLSLATQSAAGFIGNATGHPFAEGETPSLSGVLSKIVGGFLGIGNKQAPEDKLGSAGEKLTEAAKALSDAAALIHAKESTATAPTAGGYAGAPAGFESGLSAGVFNPGGPYADTISAASAQYNVPPAILQNLIGAESGFNPAALGPPIAKLGGQRAAGLGQFIPETASTYGVDVNDPTSSIMGSAHYLSDLYAQKGSWTGALGAYSGQGPNLSGYANEGNRYGPALVGAARAADSTGLPSGTAIATALTTETQSTPLATNVQQIAGSDLPATAASAPAFASAPSGFESGLTAPSPPTPLAGAPEGLESGLPAPGAMTSDIPIPSLDSGGSVTSTGLALIHAGEVVVPSDISQVGVVGAGDTGSLLSESTDMLKQAVSAIGAAFVSTATAYNGEVDRIKESANTGIPLPPEETAGFVAQHIAGGAPGGSLSSGLRLGATAAGGEDAASAGMTVYHVSPSEFDQFDPSKIGTGLDAGGGFGEGKGGYFSSDPMVMNYYSGQLAGRGLPANKYEASLPYTPDQFLQNYAPLGKQSDYVKNALDQAGLLTTPTPMIGGMSIPDVMETLPTNRNSKAYLGLASRQLTSNLTATGGDIDAARALYPESPAKSDYTSTLGISALDQASDLGVTFEDQPRNITGYDLYRQLAAGGGQDQANQTLLDAGIPGLSHPQFMRGGGAGLNTQNFVVFDPSQATMLSRNGLPIGGGGEDVAAAGAGAEAASSYPITAYHGSPYNFDQFDTSAIGTGEGAQAYGHGLYFAENEATAQYYREALGLPDIQLGGQPISGILSSQEPYASRLGQFQGVGGNEDLLDAFDYLQQHQSIPKAPRDLRNMIDGLRSDAADLEDPQFSTYADALSSANLSFGGGPPGTMYQVGIKADPSQFLDWDKPLSEQPGVQQKLLDAGMLQQGPPPAWKDFGETGFSMLMDSADTPNYGQRPLGYVNQRDQGFSASRYADDTRTSTNLGSAASLDEAQALVEGSFGEDGLNPPRIGDYTTRGMTGEDIYGNLVSGLKGQGYLRTAEPQVASQLSDAGIPGIKYLDQGSRNISPGDVAYVDNLRSSYEDFSSNAPTNPEDQEGFQAQLDQRRQELEQAQSDLKAKQDAQTSNYVIFDPASVDILKKYAIPGGIAGGAAATGVGASQAQAATADNLVPGGATDAAVADLKSSLATTNAGLSTTSSSVDTLSTSVQNQTSAAESDAADSTTQVTALADNTTATKSLTDQLGKQQIASPGSGAAPLARTGTPTSTLGAGEEAVTGVASIGSTLGGLIGGPIGATTSAVSKLVGAFNSVQSSVGKVTDGFSKLTGGAQTASTAASTLGTAVQPAASATTALTSATTTAQTVKTAETAATQIGTTATIADQTATSTMATDAVAAGAEFETAGAEASSGGAAGAAGSAVGAVSNAASGASGLLGLGGFLGFLAGGSDEIPHDGIAAIHQGEMVVPRVQAEQLRTMFGDDMSRPASTMETLAKFGAHVVAQEGIWSVGEDGTTATLHAGEMVVPADYAATLQSSASSFAQLAEPLGWTASGTGTVGTPQTAADVSPAVPGTNFGPTATTPPSNAFGTIASLGIGALAAIPLLGKLFGGGAPSASALLAAPDTAGGALSSAITPLSGDAVSGLSNAAVSGIPDAVSGLTAASSTAAGAIDGTAPFLIPGTDTALTAATSTADISGLGGATAAAAGPSLFGALGTIGIGAGIGGLLGGLIGGKVGGEIGTGLGALAGLALLLLEEGQWEVSEDGTQAVLHRGEMVIPAAVAQKLRGVSSGFGELKDAPQKLVGSFAVGAREVHETGLAMIHQGEMIVPAAPASELRTGSHKRPKSRFAQFIGISGRGAQHTPAQEDVVTATASPVARLQPYVGAFDIGTTAAPKSGSALVHAGELIVPREEGAALTAQRATAEQEAIRSDRGVAPKSPLGENFTPTAISALATAQPTPSSAAHDLKPLAEIKGSGTPPAELPVSGQKSKTKDTGAGSALTSDVLAIAARVGAAATVDTSPYPVPSAQVMVPTSAQPGRNLIDLSGTALAPHSGAPQSGQTVAAFPAGVLSGADAPGGHAPAGLLPPQSEIGVTRLDVAPGEVPISPASALASTAPPGMKPIIRDYLGAFAEGAMDLARGTALVHQGELIAPSELGRQVSRIFESRLPHFDLGAWEISRDMAGYLHQGEQVVPSGYADSFRAALSGGKGGGDVNLHYGPTVNAPEHMSLEQLLHRDGQQMVGWINSQMRSGALRPPGS